MWVRKIAVVLVEVVPVHAVAGELRASGVDGLWRFAFSRDRFFRSRVNLNRMGGSVPRFFRRDALYGLVPNLPGRTRGTELRRGIKMLRKAWFRRYWRYVSPLLGPHMANDCKTDSRQGEKADDRDDEENQHHQKNIKEQRLSRILFRASSGGYLWTGNGRPRVLNSSRAGDSSLSSTKQVHRVPQAVFHLTRFASNFCTQ